MSKSITRKKELTHKEICAKGGKATLAKKGKKHFSKIGKISAEKRWGKKK